MSAIATPVILVVVIGLVCALLLVVASKVFFVPVDERAAAIREALPGANCGGCGFAGCDDYAASLVADPELPCTKCAPGGAAAAAAIAEILGKAAGDMEQQVAQVMCNGTCDASKKILEWQGMQSCKGAKGWFTAPSACMFGCIGLGDCVKECEFEGIGIVDGVARVNRLNCVACGKCVGACPQGIIKLVPMKNQVHVLCSSTDKGGDTRKNCANGCIGCGKCAKVCNFEAITVEDNKAVIDVTKCKSCGLCVAECPTGAINSFRPVKAKKKVEAPKFTPEQLEAMKKAAAEKKAAAAEKVAEKVAEKAE